MKENLKILCSIVIFAGIILSCGKSGDDNADKLFFCENYTASTDKCDGKATKYTEGFLTVVVDIRPSKKKLAVNSVNINITDLKSGEVADTYTYETDPDMDYVYFEKVDFKKPGKFRVSALKPDGTVIVSNEIEIVE